MRMSGFIIGGLLGMAAAMYASRKRPGMAAWAVDATGDMMSAAKRKLIGRAMEHKLSSWTKEAADVTPKRSAASADNSAAAWQQIGALIESDPAVKRETEAIMKAAASGSENSSNSLINAGSSSTTH
ncbi:hypothetical protein PCCS19_58020 [Paenibacillus sp. CCS19]|uniref:hypothetical protein n=1 Tax=Paenibacillus sp. CCS19 TaxID=3158387 RepID=UPI002568FF77|nr:hypothetical protein [Paenibacillus cellulosilyticus]GMK42742.1 hypothetical protein PCCS19_58020 [Paenibacillus cellulosilyticus]